MDEAPRLSRRDLFRGAWHRAPAQVTPAPATEPSIAPLPANPATASPAHRARSRHVVLPIHRPPGAVDEAAFLHACTRCNACVEACPVHAITLAPAQFRAAAGTPMIQPSDAACIMCADTPCITACEPRVLRRDQPLKMGVAWIQPMACLAHNGSFCTVCSERCPVPGAIRVVAGRPGIDTNACTGCGVCAYVCPAPSNAVVIMPLADRPAPALTPQSHNCQPKVPHDDLRPPV